MISPAEILKKAQNKYPDLLKAALDGNNIFPLIIRANLSITKSSDPTLTAKQIQALAKNSKEKKGYGYTLEWTHRNSRTLGSNKFPSKISFEHQQDFLSFINKTEDFDLFGKAYNLAVSEFPELKTWFKLNFSSAQKNVVHQVEDFVEVCRYFKQNPRPGCYARELPLAVGTKFIENNEAVLKQWLDLILPSETIFSHEEDFHIRFGLKHNLNHFLIRILDKKLYNSIGVSFDEFSLPFEEMQRLKLSGTKVLIVENKINLLTLPKISNAIALGGLGNGVLKLKYFSWLNDCQLFYWGDIDVEGFEILNRLRDFFPQIKSFFMNFQVLNKFGQLLVSGNRKDSSVCNNLTVDEKDVLNYCLKNYIRLEQEKISQSYVNTQININTEIMHDLTAQAD